MPDGRRLKQAGPAVIVHAALCAAIVSSLCFILPHYFSFFMSFAVTRNFPRPFESLESVVYFATDNFIFITPAVVLLLWGDARVHSALFTRYGARASARWAATISLLLTAILFLIIWAMVSIC